MTKEMIRTNGDFVRPVVVAAKEHVAAVAAWARENPDEVAVGAVPYLLLVAATARHRLSLAERVIVSQAAYWLAVAAVSQYRVWKAKPAGAPPRLRKVS